jgi:hypothetical protein
MCKRTKLQISKKNDNYKINTVNHFKPFPSWCRQIATKNLLNSPIKIAIYFSDKIFLLCEYYTVLAKFIKLFS